MTFAPGTDVLVQEVWNGKVWAARPMRVIEDRNDLTLLWFPLGTRWQGPTTLPGRHREATRAERHVALLRENQWAYFDGEWDTHTLQLWRPGDWHAVWISWKPDGTHWGWYVNVQQPYVRTARGFQTMDLILDVLVDPDLSWRYKDEDELAVFVERGIVDAELETRIRATAASVVGDVEARRAPFSEPWPDWRPDPSWRLPELPAGWDSVTEVGDRQHERQR